MIMKKIFKLPYFLHEYLHYIPAQMMGLDPEIDSSWMKMSANYTPDLSKSLLITLMPALAGSMFFATALVVINLDNINALQILLSAWALWMIMSYEDFIKAGQKIIEHHRRNKK